MVAVAAVMQPQVRRRDIGGGHGACEKSLNRVDSTVLGARSLSPTHLASALNALLNLASN